MSIEQIMAAIGGLQLIGGGTGVAFLFLRLGRLTQEVKNHKESHGKVREDLEKIKNRCPLCTEGQ